MPVPKRKTSKSRRDKRHANQGIKPGAVMGCLTCQMPVAPHQLCQNCGYYKGRKVITTKEDRRQERNVKRQAQAPAPVEAQ